MPAPEGRAALRSHGPRITIGALLVLALAAAGGGWYYVDHYQPLVMGSSWGGLDIRSVQRADGTYKAVIRYDAGRTWSYETSVRNDGHWAVDLTGVTIDPDRQPGGAASDCDFGGACLQSASWSYGPVSRTWTPSDGDRDTWHPFGSFHLSPGDEVMVRLTYVFAPCAQENEGTVGYTSWQATYSFFGKHESVVPFASPLEVEPLPAGQRHRPTDCPRAQ
jgi:hypothetical protein